MEKKLQAGQTVWIETRSPRYGQAPILSETAIEKVGRKWFTVASGAQCSFSVEDGTQKPDNYTARHRVFFDKETYDHQAQEKADRTYLAALARLGFSNLSIDKVRQILSILNN